jgi:hypothetical protein
VTGLTPTYFKKLKAKRQTTLENLWMIQSLSLIV